MKRIIRRVRSLGQKATELREAMEKLPPKVAEIRQAFTMTTGQLQQLREDVQSSVADLKTDSEDSLSTALHEINGSVEVFRQAGYELSGVDMDLSIHRRLKVHLSKVADIRDSVLRGLAKANRQRRTTHALLQSLMKADEVARQTDLAHLSYDAVTVDVGPIPSLRLSWRADEVFEEEAPSSATAGKSLPPPIPTEESVFGKNSFFERSAVEPVRSPQTSSQSSVSLRSSVSAVDSSSGLSEATADSSHVEKTGQGVERAKDSLELFKTNPRYSKYSRR